MTFQVLSRCATAQRRPLLATLVLGRKPSAIHPKPRRAWQRRRSTLEANLLPKQTTASAGGAPSSITVNVTSRAGLSVTPARRLSLRRATKKLDTTNALFTSNGVESVRKRFAFQLTMYKEVFLRALHPIPPRCGPFSSQPRPPPLRHKFWF